MPFPTSPDTPEITSPVPEGVEGIAAGDVHMECTAFFDADGDSPRSSDWEIYDDLDDVAVWIGTGTGVELAHVHLNNGRFTGPLAGQRTLEFDRAYRLRTRYRDDSGDPETEYSAWSAWRHFRTAAFGIQPLTTSDIAALDWVHGDGAPVDPNGLLLGLSAAPTDTRPGFELIYAVDAATGPADVFDAPAIDEAAALQVAVKNETATSVDLDRSRLRLELARPEDGGSAETVAYLPALTLEPGEIAAYWVARNGATFEARETQVEPDFSRPARETLSAWAVPEGYVAEEVQNGLTFPTQIVFHPEAPESPEDPSYFIMELPGRIWAVGADGERWVYAEDLLDFRAPAPSGNAGQVGLGGMAVEPATGDMFVTRTYRAPAPPIDWTPTTDPIGLRVFLPSTAAWSSGSRETRVVRYVETPTDTPWSFSARVRYPFLAGRERWIAGMSFGLVAYADSDNAVFVNFESNRHRVEKLVANLVTTEAEVAVSGGTAGWLRVDYADGTLRSFYRRFENDPWTEFHVLEALLFAPARVGLNARNFFNLAGSASFEDIRWNGEPIDPETLLDDTSDSESLWLHNQVVRLRSEDGGRTASTVEVVFDMPDDVSHESHQIQDIDIAPDGTWIVSVGDGFDPYTAQDMDSFLGKILRMNPDGTAPEDNPFYDANEPSAPRSYVYNPGVRNTYGMVFRRSDGRLFCSENGPSRDRVYSPEAGWNMGYDGTDTSMRTHALFTWSPAIAPVGIDVMQTTAFPDEWRDWIFVASAGQDYTTGTSKTGKRIQALEVDAAGNLLAGPVEFLRYEGSAKATVIGLAFGPDGLYFTTLYDTDPAASPLTNARVVRVRYVGE